MRALVAGSATGPVDARRADDGCLDAVGVLRAGREDDSVDHAVRGVVREGGHFVDAVEVVVDLVEGFAVGACSDVVEE